MPNIIDKIKGAFTSGTVKTVTEAAKDIASILDDSKFTAEEKARFTEQAEIRLMEREKQQQEQALKLFQSEVGDRSNARQAEVERMKILGRADYFQYIIGIVPVLGLPALVYYVMNFEIPQRNEHLAMLIIGEVLGFVGAIYNYHYGSSMGSRIKDMRNIDGTNNKDGK